MTDTRVSRIEVLQFGEYAPVLRRFGEAAEALEVAVEEVSRLGRECKMADEATPDSRKDDWPDGESDQTRYLAGLYGRIAENADQIGRVHRHLTAELAVRHESSRRFAGSEEPAPT